ncbi:tyrosine-protein kinase SYK-like isoform X2 [Pomacea canaliculata]|uniref:tyrosine-protein kinase SYK-like isoform X2 n=1 Tax=Pomacea canaliculata TaxID=400727 RepID=UPI000D72C1BA|nr:tyrosine-protein kinase SYK-like isoform X2 [Pomacea canaliculata]
MSRLSKKGSNGMKSSPGAPASRPSPSSVPYFYGRITREEAEIFLKERGMKDGLFLLRESISPMGNYAISICYNSKIHHYSIEKQVDGMYKIPEGKPFVGPVELILHYKQNVDGFITQPTIACDRLPSQSPVAFRGITYHQLEKALQLEAKKIGADMDRAMGPMRDTLVKRVAQQLHQDMPWFHSKITREQAVARMDEDGHVSGKFLVRQRDEKNSFALTLSYEGESRHYLIAHNKDGRYSIEDGPRFDCLMMLIDNYHNKSDGLACKLTQPCCRPGYSSIDYDQYMIHNTRMSSLLRSSQAWRRMSSEDGPPPIRAPPPPPGSRPLPPRPPEHDEVNGGNAEDHPDVHLEIDADELESIYGSVRIEVAAKDLHPDQIKLENKLGQGNFGSVMKGTCTLGSQVLPVAVKTLKTAELAPGVESELMKEAKLMQQMDHKHIVRMIGVCKSDEVMLVLELAKLGPLNKYLPKNKDMPLWNVVELMAQVAKGMRYLESRNFVHRDLAARNILLCDPHFAKISDFGMSKPLSRENNYYVAQAAGKWPLKWYAPECIHYWKFDTKSDVWSYGVTLWEAASYGAKPYYKMKAQELLQFLEEGNRLAKPISCSEEVYEVMLSCWKDKDERPTFKDLVSRMEDLHKSLKQSGI